MIEMHPLSLEALAKMRLDDYLREAEQHRRARAAEREYKPAMGAAPPTVGRVRRVLARTRMSRVDAHSR